MSEYQYVAFKAVDAPLSDKALDFMHNQSTRAEITRWSFINEYHYSDFRGNALEMMRRGFDIHIHYTSFGVRRLLIRLPHGWPDPDIAKAYRDDEAIHFHKDKRGGGGTWEVSPTFETGDLDELWDIDELLDRLIPVRSEILDGDLRPLYLAHLAANCDANHDPEDAHEAAVPAGLKQLSGGQRALAEFFDLSETLVAAVAQNSPPLPAWADRRKLYTKWLAALRSSQKDEWLAKLMMGLGAVAQKELLTAFRSEHPKMAWPTKPTGRTICELTELEAKLRSEIRKKAAEAAARKRAAVLRKMAANPDPYLQQTEELASERTIEAYRQVSELLANLRDALAQTDQSGLADQQAEKLKQTNPRRYHLTAALRRQGFLLK